MGNTGVGKSRVALWDNYKLILIYLVVLGHFADRVIDKSPKVQAVFFFIYLFHMPAFAFVSGIFAKNSVKKKNYSRLIEYVTLYVFLSVMLCFFAIALYQNPNMRLFYQDSTPWYAMAMFTWVLITIDLQKVDGKYLLIGAVVLAVFVGYDSEIHDVLALSRTIVLYPFFLCGYLIDRDKLEEFAKNKMIKIGSAVALLLIAVVIYKKIGTLYAFRGLLTARNGYALIGVFDGGKTFFGACARTVYYGVAGVMCFLLLMATPTKRYFFTGWGSRSMAIYVFHMIAIYLFGKPGLIGDSSLSQYLMDKNMREMVFVLAFVTVVFFGLPFWEKILNFFVKPRWKK